MQDIKKTTAKVVEAVAVARDEALVKVGKEAEARQDQRTSKLRNRKAGKAALALVAAAGALTAGALAVKAMARKNVLDGKSASK